MRWMQVKAPSTNETEIKQLYLSHAKLLLGYTIAWIWLTYFFCQPTIHTTEYWFDAHKISWANKNNWLQKLLLILNCSLLVILEINHTLLWFSMYTMWKGLLPICKKKINSTSHSYSKGNKTNHITCKYSVESIYRSF